MSPLELVDGRFDKFATELRASRPAASEGLRNRVEEFARLEPEPRRKWGFRLPARRAAFALAALAVLGSLLAAGVTGLGGSEPSREARIVHGGEATSPSSEGAGALTVPQVHGVPYPRALDKQDSLVPQATRLQRYDATLRLRVKDVDALSNATKRAMNLTRGLGGYVASVEYATRSGRRGGATLVLRVPITNVQTALAELTSVGTILRQQTAILDVTRRAERESRQLDKLEAELAQIKEELASGSVPTGRRLQLERRAVGDRLALKALKAKRARLVRSARLARIVLTLTTPTEQAAPSPSRFDKTLDDAGAVLAREAEILLYALVVLGPLLAIGGVAIAVGKAQRRRSDQRLLERA